MRQERSVSESHIKNVYHQHITFQSAPIPPIPLPLETDLQILFLEMEEGQARYELHPQKMIVPTGPHSLGQSRLKSVTKDQSEFFPEIHFRARERS